ncbi:MepB family protein [Epilithonimonas sp. JDS]|uniref:MepB family protein n=1 Tax=Epilithonimonas sp. JDS TaxID=2902797 RepID=UPI001E647A45|nr:MepB family protein [Epilithonimonas sp. JDS]MCD9855296.1 MepB family protein [Epilithonimonas sp. JDS]
MIKEIAALNDLVFRPLNLEISELTPDPECEDYLGFNFKINQTKIKFRKSKLTPKKVGQFVTFWKRDPDGKTVPFDINDDFDCYMICIEENMNSGLFIFPKTVLEKENLISSDVKTGKRGFRIYADWHFPNSRQAEKTKLWQAEFFINFSDNETMICEKFKKIFNSKSQ